jgi:hypothetical protein
MDHRITIEQARAIIEEAQAVENHRSDQRVREAMQAAREAAARMSEVIGTLYEAVSEGDRWVHEPQISLFGESMWGNSEAPHGMHVVLENSESYYEPGLIEDRGLVALNGCSLAWYLGEIEQRLAKYGTAG